jgi:iron complex outermembrane receptor protein
MATAVRAAEADASSATVSEVVVTAERRSEPLLQVPATITAISGETMKNQGMFDMKSILELVPNAVLPDDPENFETYINIRGIHQADINAEPNFGLYRNGIFTGGERANLGAQVDVASVEVLSGPQSGLYGRDAVGGVVNVIYATPTMDGNHGYLIGSYGNWQRTEIQGALNIPLAPNFAVRAAGWWFNQNQGQLYDTTLNQYIDRFRDMGGRLSAKWNVTDRLSVLWMAEVEDKHGPSFEAYAPNGITDQFGVACCGFPSTGPETLSTIQEDTPNTEEWSQTYLSQDITYDTRSWAGVFEVQAAYRNYHLYEQEDQDHTGFGPDSFPMDVQQVQYRNEGLHNFYVDLLWKSPADQKFSWIAGADYFNETFKFDRIIAGSTDFNLLNTPLEGPGFTYGNLLCSFLMAPYDGGCEAYGGSPGLPGAGTGKYPYTFPNIGVQSGANAFGLPGSAIDTQAFSLFATGTYHVTSRLSVTGDIRWDWLQKHLIYSQGPAPGYGSAEAAAYLDPLFAQIFPPFAVDETRTFVNAAPSVNVKYELTSDANLYAVFATGFRAGGFNLSTSSIQYLPYGAEKDYNYEIGTKTLWLGGKLGLNADVFYMRQTNLVETESDPTEPAFLGLYYLSNVGSAGTWGAEFQGTYRPVSWAGLGLSVGWLDDHIIGGSSQGVSVVGQQIPLTRHVTIDMTGDAAYPLSDKVKLVGDFNWRLEYGGFLPAATGILETTPYQNLDNLRLDAGFAFGGTRIVGFVDNAFNSIIPQFQYADGVENVNVGRTFGIRAETKF